MPKQSITIIEKLSNDPCIDIALSTIKMGKQAIIFVNTKRGAESLAEKISQKLKKDNVSANLAELSEKISHALPSPTKQCQRLAAIVREGIAFHHSGLVSEQRRIVEHSFRYGFVKIIVCTPSLALGVDLPAYRVIIRDLKRYGLWGMEYIPVLEYQQQIGRAGRPSFDSFGEAICVADSDVEKQEIYEKYVIGDPEAIISKLAVEPIMRTYILSLIASEFVNSVNNLEDFFSKTFYAQQYGDISKLNAIIQKMLAQLEDWGFVEVEGSDKHEDKDFVSALKYTFKHVDRRLKATLLGHRVSELYLDPYTANFLIEHLKKAITANIKEDRFNPLSLMHLVCSCLELRPLLRVKNKELDDIIEYMNSNSGFLLTKIPELFDDDYDEFVNSLKTAKFFMEWLDEKDEQFLLERFDIRPGEISSKKDIADWLLYSAEELSKLMKMHVLIKDIAKLRFRLKYGAREELIPLLQLKNIGRVRARIMFNNKIKDISDVKKIDLTTLTQLLGKNIALDVKKQVGQDLTPEKVETREGKRKGQKSMKDYD
jgi:helicase